MSVFHSEAHQNEDSQAEENADSETREVKLSSRINQHTSSFSIAEIAGVIFVRWIHDHPIATP